MSSRLILAFMLSLTAAFLYAIALLTGYGTSAHSQNHVLMAIDADPQASGIQECVGNVSVGTSVDIDFVIQDVPDIEGFGLRLLYDGPVLSVISKDKSVSVLGSSGLDVGDSLPDTDGSFLDGYVGEGASGSGILMRYTVRAKATGLTWLHLVVGDVDTNYVDSAHLLTHVPDQTEDALVSVGAPCPQSLPPTASLAPGETREAPTSSSPAPTSGPQGTPTTLWPTPPQGASQRASPAPVTPAAELQGTPSSGSQEVQRANTPAATAQRGSDGGRAGTPGEGGGFPWFALAIGVAVAAGVGGVAVIYWRRFARRGS